MRLLLVRHAVTEATAERLGGRTLADLSDDGRAQAKALAERLAGVDLAAVYTSPVVRARSTAAAIAERHGIEVAELAGVQEFEYGEWTDRPLEELRDSDLFKAIQMTPGRVAFPGGESFPEVHERAMSAIESVVDRHDDEDTVAVVSHADVIKLIVAAYVGLHIDLFQRLWVSPASLSALALPKEGRPILVLFNDTSHLGESR